MGRILVTRRGRVVAVLTPPDPVADAAKLFGFMPGTVIAPPGFDFTAPTLDEPLSENERRLHE